MPHDARGRLIEEGDWIKATHFERSVIAQVTVIHEGTTTCNVQGMWLNLGGTTGSLFSASETTLVLKANGSEPEAGKAPVAVADENSAPSVS